MIQKAWVKNASILVLGRRWGGEKLAEKLTLPVDGRGRRGSSFYQSANGSKKGDKGILGWVCTHVQELPLSIGQAIVNLIERDLLSLSGKLRSA